MQVSIKSNPQAKQLTITLTDVDWVQLQQGNFYEGERQVQQIVALTGRELTRDLLRSHDSDAHALWRDGRRWSRKEASPGHYLTLYGEVVVTRHLYQTSAGGETYCPLEARCQLSFGQATPLLAELLAFKVSALTPGEVAQDVRKSHDLALSVSFIQQTAQRIGQLAVDKTDRWQLDSPPPEREVAVIATGLDGTTVPLRDENYKEAMCGTIALYDGGGERLRTEYIGAMPEAGKATFTDRFTTRVAAVQARHPQALHVVLADGARWNWQVLSEHYPDAIQILDFWHAAQHLAQAAEVIFGAGLSPQKSAWFETWKTVLRDEPNGVAGVIRTLLYYRNRGSRSTAARAELDTQLNYFRQHAERMHYALYRAAGWPIGSGVTEAGCKELIKARFCRSGMRWKRETGATVLQLRAIRLSNQWESFWQKVIRYVA
ncbi:MAG: ISKra4 family transposase [Acidobacteria bacterium]|nr:ISKra4 family transposase [Acidobacteriota bacterium]